MTPAIEMSQFCPRKYVAVVCDSDWYVGYIVVHKDQGDFLLKFMRGKEQDNLTFSWPQRGDKCVFHLLMICVHFEQHHCMEGVDQSIDLSMLIHSSRAFFGTY
jgi:hypothetical protein